MPVAGAASLRARVVKIGRSTPIPVVWLTAVRRLLYCRAMRLDEIGGPAAEAARAFAGGGPLPGALPDEVAEALIETLVSRGSADRLGELAAMPDKALAKRARR